MKKILNCLLPEQIWHSVGNFIFFSLLLVFHIGYLGVNVLLQVLASKLCHCLSMAIDGWWWSTFLGCGLESMLDHNPLYYHLGKLGI